MNLFLVGIGPLYLSLLELLLHSVLVNIVPLLLPIVLEISAPSAACYGRSSVVLVLLFLKPPRKALFSLLAPVGLPQ